MTKELMPEGNKCPNVLIKIYSFPLQFYLSMYDFFLLPLMSKVNER